MTLSEPLCMTCGEPRGWDGRRNHCAACQKKKQMKRQASAAKPRQCGDCGTDISHRHRVAKYCFDCTSDAKKRRARNPRPILNDNEKARAVTKYAVKVGFLPDPKSLKCMDCGCDAECYDHRDYNKPLDVDAVCLRCNASRGRGVPLKINKAA